MYKTLKKNIASLLPKSFIIKNEMTLRSMYGIFHIGNKHQCTICSHRLKSFVSLENHDLLCPFCGSISRTRRLWKLLNEDGVLQGRVLHFSPSRSIYRRLIKIKEIQYHSSDFENEFLADFHYDITNIDQPDSTFDLIICYHILEHIPDDIKAMTELYRVLRPVGIIYVQTPFKDGLIYENDDITTPDQRLEHFGQEDHVRIYSVDGLKKRLEEVGFEVDVLTFDKSEETSFNGLGFPETILKLTKLSLH